MQIQRLGHDSEIPRRLIEAASEVFARHGYAGTRVREIVRAADVNLASVNYYFGGKEGLYAATLLELAQERMAQAASTAASRTPEEALFGSVKAILHRFVDTDRHSPLGRILAHESMNPTVYFDRLVTDIVRPELERLRQLVEAIAPGAFDEAAANRAAMSILGQCVFYLFARGAVERLFPEVLASDSLARHITDFSLAALRGLKPLSAPAT